MDRLESSGSCFELDMIREIWKEKEVSGFRQMVKDVQLGVKDQEQFSDILASIHVIFPNANSLSVKHFNFDDVVLRFDRNQLEQIFSVPIPNLSVAMVKQVAPVTQEISICNSWLKSLYLSGIDCVKKLQVKCENLEELTLRDTGENALNAHFENLMENFLQELADDKIHSQKLKEITLSSFDLEEPLRGKPSKPTQISISRHSFPSLLSLHLFELHNLVSLNLKHSKIKSILLAHFPFLSHVEIESESLENFSLDACSNIKSLKVHSANNLSSVDLSYANFLENLEIESTNLHYFSIDFYAPQRCFIETLKKCPNLRHLEIGFYDRSFCLSTPTNKLLKVLPQVCPQLLILKISPQAVRITEKAIRLVKSAFLERGRDLELECKYSIEQGEFIPSEERKFQVESVIKKMKGMDLHKFFNSWRVYRDLSTLKGMKMYTIRRDQRINFQDLCIPS